MTIAEKLTTIAENEQRVYEAGQQAERIKVEGEIEALETEIATLTEQKESLEADVARYLRTIESLNKNNVVLTERIINLQYEVEQLNSQIAEKQSQITTLNARISELEAEVNSQIELRLEAEAEAKMWKADAAAQNDLRLEAEAQLPIKYNEGFAAGKKAEFETWWEQQQQGGKRESYNYFCFGLYNPYYYFQPIYNIGPSCREMFRGWIGGELIDVAQRLEERGVTLNTSGTDFPQFASYATVITRFPTLDCSGATTLQSAFVGCIRLVTIDKLIVHAGLVFTASTFRNCVSLEKVIFEGVIGKNGLDVSSCKKLSRDSIVSIINALSDSTSGLSVTLSLDAVNKAFETSPGANDGSTSAEGLALVATKPNWTVVLV